jgi:hypothetical protein
MGGARTISEAATMDQTLIQRLHDNLQVFEKLADEWEIRAANMPTKKRVGARRYLAEIHAHIAQLKERIAAGEQS